MTQTTFASLEKIIQKYNLDISITEVKDLGSYTRIEAEFYTSGGTSSDEKSVPATEIIESSDYGTSDELNENEEGMPTLRLNEFDSYFIGVPSKYCSGLNENTISRLLLKKGDVLICRTNGNPQYVGKAAIVMEDKTYVFASYLFRIRTNKKLLPEVLTVFLNSTKGRKEIEKYSMVSNQANFSPAKFRELKIPLPPLSLQSQIADLVQEAHKQRELSKSLYAEAEKILLDELGLTDWKPTEENIAEKMSEEVELFGRCDAEFFQPKYDEVLEKIRTYKGGHTTLKKILQNIDTGEYSESYSKKQDDLVFYIRSTNINDAGLIDIDEEYYVNPTKFKRVAKKGQIITPRVGALGIFANIDEELDGSIYSDNVLCMTIPDSFYSDVYTLYLNSSINRLLIERFSRGSVQQRLNQETLKFLEIPIFPEEIQLFVSSKIIASHEARKISKDFLERAKRAIEIFIEEDETAAEKWLDVSL